MADAELMITPDLARNELNKSMVELQKAMKKTADQVERDFEKAISDGVQDGAKKGGRKAKRSFREMFSATSGARNAVGGTILGVLTAGLFDTIGRADAGSEQLRALLGESTAKQQISLAKQSGIDLSAFAQLSQNFRAGGLTEQQDINAVIFDLNARLGEAKFGDDTLLKNFVQYEGADRINRILASIGNQDPTRALTTLDQLGFATDAPAILAALDRFRGDDGRVDFESFSQVSDAAREEASQLKTEAEKAEKFRQEMSEHNRQWRSKFLDQIKDGDISAFFKDEDRIKKDNLKLLKDYQKNLEAATTARVAIRTVMDEVNEHTVTLVKLVQSLADFFVKREDGIRNERKARDQVQISAPISQTWNRAIAPSKTIPYGPNRG